ncbi:Purine-binding chemotaxis protein [uncultured Coleofasciculus sp.]|uniref:Purine-binding chemotaxis protein n=1 Tax=uncultured Coleofasciculus sp. TaxID=1267456 RepID=A0A6J4K6C1_9CYAN|nr:Purine-binding chemotaxis protein [uncultured Coleofasciculus sp.]
MSNFSSFPGSLSPPTDSLNSSASEQYLRFYLEPNTTALLPLQQLTEVITIPVSQIVPIFNMPAWVMGVYNWRGEILWMVDLNHLIGLTPWYQQTGSGSVHSAIVLYIRANNATANNGKSKILGLVVNRIEDIEWCNSDLIQSPPSSTVTPELVPFLRGYWLKSNREMLVVLNGEAILASMPNVEVSVAS